MTLSAFQSAYQDQFLAAVAAAANVTVEQVTIVSVTQGARRRLRSGMRLTVVFRVRGATQLHPHDAHALRRLNVLDSTWQHAHELHIRRLLPEP